jgi:SAM-dependent methyltransferase
MIKELKYYYMGRSRKKKYEQFISLSNPSDNSTILDVGVADKEYSPFDNYLEKAYPHPGKITALSIHPLEEFRKRYPLIKELTYKGGTFPFKDKEFSIVYSNAVIEHVGEFAQQVEFVREINRCGSSFYFTTPAREAPVEMHTNYPFIHWLPKKTFDQFLKSCGKGWATGNYLNLLRKKDIVNIMTEARVKEFKVFTQRMGHFPFHYAVWGRCPE